ncbi:mitochondrial holo-[acyl-carrier-protein] synthase [Andalucia godoyi]|uniref:Mitochondrial holo-[acyl-carrier-protein] synthase n=1 Tax=Andalucia godoyi TaxID=505711 RepID=A0A8K0AGU7_ANDGO|nr:mitochondrial holo-[acyl-carrier-protein] synthase [Andalucia godoyi]|eukprot:ANDGO_07791.mRNA.1 mitochondrial holo-[acyl-carrier-protein] synthase
MIVGLGTDLVSHARISALLKRYGARFVQRILADSERQLLESFSSVQETTNKRSCEDNGRTVEFVAARWAAKEAVWKALGRRTPAQSVAVLRDAVSGAPVVHVSGFTLQRAVHRAGSEHKFWISISHESGPQALSMAVCVLEAGTHRS